jgi:hypothetical protein
MAENTVYVYVGHDDSKKLRLNAEDCSVTNLASLFKVRKKASKKPILSRIALILLYTRV